MSTFVVRISDCLEPLLPSCIPDLIYIGYCTCNLTVLPLKSKVLILKSTPMVGKKLSLKTLSLNLSRRDDFPTAELPINSNLNK